MLLAMGGIVLVATIPTLANGQRGRGGPKPHLVPFPFLNKEAGFEAVKPKPRTMHEMQALLATVGSDVIPKFKKPQNVIQMEFGMKSGGNAMVYETPIAPGVKAEDVFPVLMKMGTFRDHQYEKEWSIVSVPDKKLLIMVSGNTPAVRDFCIKNLAH